MATTVRNPFNPLRVTGKNGAPTVEELSRVQDLIRSAFADVSSQVTVNLTNIAGDITTIINTGVTTLSGPAVVYTDAAGTLQVDTAHFVYDAAGRRLGLGTPSPQAMLHQLGSGTVWTYLETTSAGGSAGITFANPATAGNYVQQVAAIYYTGNSWVNYEGRNCLVLSTPYGAVTPSLFALVCSGAIVARAALVDSAIGEWTISAPQNIGSGFILNTGFAALGLTNDNTSHRARVVFTSTAVNNVRYSLIGDSLWLDNPNGPIGLLGTGVGAAGLLKSASTGILGIASAGTDYVQTVSVTAPITNTGTAANPNIGHATTAVTPGSYTLASITVDSRGHLTAASSGSTSGLVPSTRVLNATSPIRIDGGASADLSADRTLSHANSGVSAGSYTYASITVDAMGHLTAAANGATPQPLITWPASPRVLVSSGTSTVPTGYAGFTYDGTTLLSSNSSTTTEAARVRTAITSDDNPTLIIESSAATGQSMLHFWSNSGLRGGLRASFSGNVYLFSNGGGLVFRTGGDDAGTLRMQISGTTGAVSIPDLGAGGIVKASAGAGTLSIAAAGTDYQAAITWPTAAQVLVSAGASTPPVGDTRFTFDTTAHLLTLASGATQAWYNVDGTDYERVRAFWSANEFRLVSEKGGTGTVRPIKIDAGTSDVRLTGSSVAVQTLTAGGMVTASAGTGILSVIPIPTSLAWYTEANLYGQSGYLPVSSATTLTANPAEHSPGTLVSTIALTIKLLSNPLTSGTVTIKVVSSTLGSTICSKTFNTSSTAGVYTVTGNTSSASANDTYGLLIDELSGTPAGVSAFAFSATAVLS